MDNMQKRAERDMDKARRYQHEAIMRDLLPVIDGLEQGLENAEEGNSAREGLELTRKLLLKARSRPRSIPKANASIRNGMRR